MVKPLGKTPQHAVREKRTVDGRVSCKKDGPGKAVVRPCFIHSAYSISENFFSWNTPRQIPRPGGQTQFLLLLVPVMLIPRAHEL